MTTYDQALERLKGLLEKHETVQAFKKSQNKIKQLPGLTDDVIQMKAYQQEAVLLQKMDKPKASASKEEASQKLQQSLDQLPLVQTYRSQMQDASDLLSHITKRIEDKINEELAHGK
ncbi:YlbF family regulator [Streptococcus loxodontisalivarius]|uniref:Cell fate (Sporulation/competence/biofilm development) regulator YmcA (YheA/YmcA/DUF963 family) n=1 Tax=Streptococcus loxodontisalivarius TaxID=1349415 RepID=A0ABS2PPH4_9STRE|nr:YlbF family regulator [Streptococcus loxodontisalivarius]MBM7641939.1 cell fate (sporulation/competence/biofilm development) regulator YmcA (YheA/YmcA/DUF963 family) [Streptococcus loxodontisalivarius]